MPSAKSFGKPAKRSKPKTRREMVEAWQLSDARGKQLALVSRSFGGSLNIYLGGSDEPQRVRILCWEDAKDYVWRWIRNGMPQPK